MAYNNLERAGTGHVPPPTADIRRLRRHVRKVPLPDASVRQRGCRPISADREAALVARTIDPDDVVKCTVVPRRSSAEILMAVWRLKVELRRGPPRFLPSRASFDCPLREFKHGRFAVRAKMKGKRCERHSPFQCS